MHTDKTVRPEPGPIAFCHETPAAGAAAIDAEQVATCVLDDCLFALGQAVGMRATLDYDAVIWIRRHFHERFVRAVRAFGDRWGQDRENVTGAAFMMGERAVRYAAGRPSIGVAEIRQAAADVQRYCMVQSTRAARGRGQDERGETGAMIAGYWCR